MHTLTRVLLTLGCCWLAVTGGPACGQQSDSGPALSANEEAIRQAAVKFVEAYNGKDAAAVAALFGPQARLEEADGTVIEGREEIEAAFREVFEADPQGAISLTVHSLQFITPDVAVERGATEYFPDGKLLTSRSQYIVVHLRKEGAWRMISARTLETELLSNYEMLRELEWLVGDWIDEGHDGVVETSCRWDANRSFLLQDFEVQRRGEVTVKGTQRIGWDPQAKQFRAWIFDSAGGFGEARWIPTGDEWVSKVSGVSAEGVSVSATRTFRMVSRDQIILTTTDRIAGNERLPDFSVTLTRKAPAPRQPAAGH